MSEAKAAISLASEYHAEKYAKQELDAANAALLDSHNFIKDDRIKEAKSSASLSKKKADEALAKTLPLLSKDALDEAKASITEIQSLFAPEFAKEKYDAADTLVKDSSASFDAKDYILSYQKALKAKDAATDAKNTVLEQLPSLKGRLAEIKDSAAALRSHDVQNYAAETLTALDAKTAEAEVAIVKNNIKTSSESIAAAGDLLAKANIDFKKGSSLAKIAVAEQGLVKVQSSPFAADFAENLKTISAAIGDAHVLAESSSFPESEAKAAEALALIDALVIELQKKEDADRIAKAALAEKEKEDLAAQQKAEKEKPAVVTKEQGKEEPREYVVIYNPKHSDCLWRIAEKMYKNANLWPLIFMANRAQIKDPDLIYPGQKFTIPPIPERKTTTNLTNPKPDELKTHDPSNPSDKAGAKSAPGSADSASSADPAKVPADATSKQ